MSTDCVEQTTTLIGRVEGQVLPPHAIRLLSDGEPLALERLAAATGWSFDDVEAALAAQTSSAAGSSRRTGRWGTAARVVVGATLIVLAVAVWKAGWLDLLIGLALLPILATLLMWRRRRSAAPLRLGAAGHLVTLAHVAVTVSIVPEAAALFYGGMALVAGLHGNGGCEITALANWLRGRDDRIGCPLFEPFDVLDRERLS
jgi:hypothetical protein